MLLVQPFTPFEMAEIEDFDYTNPNSIFEIMFLFFLNFVLQHFFPGLLHIFILWVAFISHQFHSWVVHRSIIKRLDALEARRTPGVRRNVHEGNYYTEIVEMPENDTHEVKLSIEDVKTMMEALDGQPSNNDLGFNDNAEIERLFDEELSLGEVEEAFDLFDENGDGFIDAGDLKKVLCAMGFTVASEVDQCRRMISAFDSNGDGLIDFEEFAKLVEQSFC